MNRKQNCLNRKWNYFSLLKSLDRKTSLTKDSLFSPMIPKWCHKRELELSKQEMELFLPFSVIVSKNFFYKRSLIWSNHSKIVFRNRKWNHLNRKWNHFSLLQALDQNTSLTKDSLFSPMIPKWFS